jgi:hypothetical protein
VDRERERGRRRGRREGVKGRRDGLAWDVQPLIAATGELNVLIKKEMGRHLAKNRACKRISLIPNLGPRDQPNVDNS